MTGYGTGAGVGAKSSACGAGSMPLHRFAGLDGLLHQFKYTIIRGENRVLPVRFSQTQYFLPLQQFPYRIRLYGEMTGGGTC